MRPLPALNRRHLLQAAAGSVGFALAPGLRAQPPAPWRMAYFETYSPLSFRMDGALRGILPDVIGAVLTRMGQTVEHTGYPWARAQLLTQNGEQDAICTIATPERLEYAMAAQEPVVSAPRRIFVRNDHPLLPQLRQVKTLADLRALNPTVVSYAGNGWSKANLQDFKLESGINFETALKMLIARRGDVFIDNALTMQYSLQRTEGGSAVLMLPQADLEVSQFQLLVSKKSSHLASLAAFDAALRQFKRTPAYPKIFQTYGIQN